MKKITLIALFIANILFPLFASGPSFLWEKDPQQNNCYNYALGIPTPEFLMPGEASGRAVEVYTCENDFNQIGLVQASQNDGLRLVQSTEECADDEQVVALFNMPELDFHWQRLEDSGIWTHKRGSKLPTDKDFQGKVITDLLKADLGQYKYFCGFFCVDYSKLKVR